jgi:hypothetical protein
MATVDLEQVNKVRRSRKRAREWRGTASGRAGIVSAMRQEDIWDHEEARRYDNPGHWHVLPGGARVGRGPAQRVAAARRRLLVLRG